MRTKCSQLVLKLWIKSCYKLAEKVSERTSYWCVDFCISDNAGTTDRTKTTRQLFSFFERLKICFGTMKNLFLTFLKNGHFMRHKSVSNTMIAKSTQCKYIRANTLNKSTTNHCEPTLKTGQNRVTAVWFFEAGRAGHVVTWLDGIRFEPATFRLRCRRRTVSLNSTVAPTEELIPWQRQQLIRLWQKSYLTFT